MSTNRIWAIGYLIVVIGLVVSFYVDAAQNPRIAAVDARVAAAEAKGAKAAVACIGKVIEATNQSTVARSEAAQRRDEALVASKRALRELIRLRVIEQIGTSEPVRQAAEQYMTQTQKFIEASGDLAEARVDNPVPDPAKVC